MTKEELQQANNGLIEHINKNVSPEGTPEENLNKILNFYLWCVENQSDLMLYDGRNCFGDAQCRIVEVP